MDKCDERLVRRLDEHAKRIHSIEMTLVRIETSMKHTLENKHAETLAESKAIDAKFRWISVVIGAIASFSIIVHLFEYVTQTVP
jgi:hypothetical protein